ncbi:MAG TPA: F0F1 ATP synthase subunit delta [Candidatus Saccharimonadia bacterium]|jgi:F0F1-type ATP synthase delta subunit|nr:F0F1 ATP synthase subunit delta [Candidatus Saccharimonadia bacterium]
MTSRAQVASYIAEKLPRERKAATLQAAAWLIDTKRAGQARYLARDVAQALAGRGYSLVQITSARPLDGRARDAIERYVKSQTGTRELELETMLDPSLVGGVRIETPGMVHDASVRHMLAKFVEGVSE